MRDEMIVLRVIRGVTSHFPVRISEWAMLWPSFGLWMALSLSESMFSTSRSFVYLDRWGEERTWALFVAVSGLLRLMALTINGTFKGFAFSPHIRAFASIAGVVIWSQISLGFLMAWLNFDVALFGLVMISTLVMLEIANTYRSWSDVGKNVSERG